MNKEDRIWTWAGIVTMLLIVSVGLATAGTISEDCISTENVCVEGHWVGHGFGRHYVCTDWDTVCSDSITTTTDIDADTLNGKHADDLMSKGGGFSKKDLGFYLLSDDGFFYNYKINFVEYLKDVFVTQKEYRLLETWAYQNGFNPDDEALQIQCAELYGSCGDWTTVKYE